MYVLHCNKLINSRCMYRKVTGVHSRKPEASLHHPAGNYVQLSLMLSPLSERGSERKRQNVGKRMVHGGRRLKTPLLHPNFPRESNLLCLKLKAQVGRSVGRGRSPLHRCFPRCVYKRAKPAPLSLTRSLIPRPIDGWSGNRLSLSLSLSIASGKRSNRSVCRSL